MTNLQQLPNTVDMLYYGQVVLGFRAFGTARNTEFSCRAKMSRLGCDCEGSACCFRGNTDDPPIPVSGIFSILNRISLTPIWTQRAAEGLASFNLGL